MILSIVGVDQLPQLVYYRAKSLQEDLLRQGPAPYSIVRAIHTTRTGSTPPGNPPAGREQPPGRVLPLQRRPGRRRWETRVYHRRAAEKARGHHLDRWLQRGGRLGLRRRGGRGHLWLGLRLGDEGRGFVSEFFKPFA